jgi:hypothetical protein
LHVVFSLTKILKKSIDQKASSLLNHTLLCEMPAAAGPTPARANASHCLTDRSSPRPQPPPQWWLVAAPHAASDDIEACCMSDIGDAANAGGRQIHARNGSVADAEASGKLAARLQEVPAR